jgi:hypothetical protein
MPKHAMKGVPDIKTIRKKLIVPWFERCLRSTSLGFGILETHNKSAIKFLDSRAWTKNDCLHRSLPDFNEF